MGLELNQYVAEKKRAVFERLRQGMAPGEGSFDAAAFEEAKDKGVPQMGTATFRPGEIRLEFIYRDPLGANQVFTVTLEAPERIVFMPVPKWVHQTVWQGEVDGTYRFESEAFGLMKGLEREMMPGENEKWFEKRLPTTRE